MSPTFIHNPGSTVTVIDGIDTRNAIAAIDSITARIGMPPMAILRWNPTSTEASAALDKVTRALLSTLHDDH